MDADGDLDLLVGVDLLGAVPLRLYRNDGLGRFADVTVATVPPVVALGNALAVGDVDGDGDVDVVASNEFGADRLYVNDGSGRFTLMSLAPGGSSALALADFDGDGDLDMIAATILQASFYLNDGSGRFAWAAGRVPPDVGLAPSFAVSDVDGDGDLDVAVRSAHAINPSLRLLRNYGTAHFVDATAAQLPAFSIPIRARLRRRRRGRRQRSRAARCVQRPAQAPASQRWQR